jgi:actin-related protein
MNDSYIGEEAGQYAPLLSLTYQTERGEVTNWADVEKIWHHVYYQELKTNPADHPLVLTGPSLNRKPSREKATQIQFETFNVPSLVFEQQGLLSLYASGLTTGIVLEIGDGLTQIVPVWEGLLLTAGVSRANIAGRDITAWLAEMLRHGGYKFAASADLEILSDIKENLAYVALDFDAELEKRTANISYTMSSGDQVALSTERFRCAELLFKPHCNGLELDGVDQLLFESIGKSGLGDDRRALFRTIVLSGGTTMLPGFPERLQKEITDFAPATLKTEVRVTAKPGRECHAWVGGSIFASIEIFPTMLATRSEYNDEGASIVHRRGPCSMSG